MTRIKKRFIVLYSSSSSSYYYYYYAILVLVVMVQHNSSRVMGKNWLFGDDDIDNYNNNNNNNIDADDLNKILQKTNAHSPLTRRRRKNRRYPSPIQNEDLDQYLRQEQPQQQDQIQNYQE